MKDIDALKNNAYIQQLINDKQMPVDCLNDNYNLFLRVIASQNDCHDCQGLAYCKQKTTGQRLALDYQNALIEEVEYCKYSQVNIDKDNFASKYIYCDIAKNFLDLDLDNLSYTDDQKELYALLLGILHKKSSKGLYIVGDLGVGKTYLCTALANSLVKKGCKVAFVKVANFFNDMKANIINNNQLIDITINKLKKVEYLFFDDIGAESVSAFVRDDILFRILDYRLEHHLMTIFTSNLDKNALAKHYQYDRNEKSNLMKAERLLERIDILADEYVLSGKNMRRL